MQFRPAMPAEPSVMGFPVGDYLRRLRRVADMSQRELAKAAKLPHSWIERVESGQSDPRLGRLRSVLDLVAWHTVVVDVEGRLVLPLGELGGDLRDGADRRFPPHLDVIVDPDFGDWWGDRFGLARPPETFARDRAERDARRAKSQFSLYRGPYRRD